MTTLLVLLSVYGIVVTAVLLAVLSGRRAASRHVESLQRLALEQSRATGVIERLGTPWQRPAGDTPTTRARAETYSDT